MKQLCLNTFLYVASIGITMHAVFAFHPLYAAASSHSDAPLIKQDPQANITDVYAFVGTKYNDSNQKVLNVLVQVRPFSDPGDGAIYDRFADDALYSIHITNPFNAKTRLRYNFLFSDVNPATAPGLKNPNTILSYGIGTEVGPITSIGDNRQNYTQTYSVAKLDGSVVGGLAVAPPNVGVRTTPFYNDSISGKAVSGAVDYIQLDAYTQQAIHDLPSGEAVFAGPRDDGFYADTSAIFDLLDSRILDNNGGLSDGLGQDGGGIDGFQGFNVLVYAVQIPISQLEIVPGYPKVGVFASVSRRKYTRRAENGEIVSSGPWILANRMGNPLFNELFVALKDKDHYNYHSPTVDAEPDHFISYALNPEPAFLINFVVFGDTTGQSPIVTTGRSDLAAIFIPDLLKVDVSTDPVRLPGQSGFSRLSHFGGDTATGGIPGGWPNGRRIGDDVVDIVLTTLASGPSYSSIVLIGDNVAANDQLYHQVFPYLATPHAGPTTTQRSAP